MLDALRDLVEKHPKSYWRTLELDGNLIAVWMKKQVPFLFTEQYTWATRTYWVLNGLSDFPCCLNEDCGKKMVGKNVRNLKAGFPLHCCPQCAKESQHRKDAYAEGFKKKHGVSNPSQLQEVKDHKRATCLERLGVDNPAKSAEVRSKIEETSLENYGTKCPFEAESVKCKIRSSLISAHGVPSYSQTEEFLEKTKATNMKNFGVEWPNQDPEIRKAAQKRYAYDGISFDSAPEIALYIWLTDNGIPFEYQPSISFEYECNGVVRRCMPDFKIGEKWLLEIKGSQFFEDKDSTKKMVNPYDHSQDDIYEAKHQCMLRNGVQFLTEDDCKGFIRHVQKTRGKDFLRSCKRQ